MTHAVRAHLAAGPVSQLCADAQAAARLFDRLRGINPRIRMERLQDGQVIERSGYVL